MSSSSQSLSDTYQKKTQLEHILDRPDTYIGTVNNEPTTMWLFDDESSMMQPKDIMVNPGLYKIVDEIVVNARDQYVRGPEIPVTEIRISVDPSLGRVKVWNNGSGIDVALHPEHKVYIPEMIFGELLTSANFNDNEKRITGGKNGYGAKLTNAYSEEFILETVDSVRGRKYVQRFYGNMYHKDSPTITKAKKPYTSVDFLPDYKRFHMQGMSSDMFDVIRTRAYDLCACTGDKVSVYFNDAKLPYKNFKSYVDLYLGGKETLRVYEKINDYWEVVVATSSNGFQQISFANGIKTTQGGKHVDVIESQITKKLSKLIEQKKKKVIRPNVIKEFLWVFVNATIINPDFGSQTKELLKTPPAHFGSDYKLSDEFIAKVYAKSGIVEQALFRATLDDDKSLSKLNAKKKSTVSVPKLMDANKAGGKDSQKCTLILTEGDSAMALAVAGVASIKGHDYYGIFPLKGKPINVRDTTVKKLTDNEEISNIIKILGLEIRKDYKSPSELRYGRIMVLADQDHDGYHIKGLIMNMMASMWPSLVVHEDFIVSMLTPIVKATKTGKKKDILSFYNLTDYHNWHTNATGGWTIKYYKGLGTSSAQEAKEYFTDMKLVKYKWTEESNDALDLAFNKKRADDRKAWLMQYDRSSVLDYKEPIVQYETFVHKELIHFSNRDLERSIPSVCDGLKESTRKILFGCFKKGLYNTEIKVSQLSGYVSEQSAYHHGEASLQGAIIGMAQYFVGSNNINLLFPSGQLGTRLRGGKDHASPRYIFTKLSSITKFIFIQDDFAVLDYIEDDGMLVEPRYYTPVIPMILVNGAMGIGTGFSTTIPCHNPLEIIDQVEHVANVISARGDPNGEDIDGVNRVIDSVDLKALKPWYSGFKGTIDFRKNAYASHGVYEIVNSHTIRITEIPVGEWTGDYHEYLKKLMDTGIVKSFQNHGSDVNIDITVTLQQTSNVEDIDIDATFKMSSNKGLSVSNFHLYNEHGQIRKYADTTEIIKDFCKVRFRAYKLRKTHMLKKMRADLNLLEHRIRFVNDVISGQVKVMNVKNADILQQLEILNYDMAVSKDLIDMPIRSLTLEKKEKLEAEVVALQATVKALEKTSLTDLWLTELGVLRSECITFKEYMDDFINVDDDIEEKPKAKAKSKSSAKPKAKAKSKPKAIRKKIN